MDMLLFLNVSVSHLLDQPLKKFFIRRLYFYLLSIHSCCNSNFGQQSLPYLLLTSMLHQENSFFVKNNFQCLLFYEKRNSIVAKLNQSVQCAFLDQVQTLHDINKNARLGGARGECASPLFMSPKFLLPTRGHGVYAPPLFGPNGCPGIFTFAWLEVCIFRLPVLRPHWSLRPTYCFLCLSLLKKQYYYAIY